jgi:molybdopterin-biosynthesis enzyme MoeA-like protein
VQPSKRSPRRAAVGPPRPGAKARSADVLTVEVVLVGREILRGRVQDQNARAIASFFSLRGARIRRITVVDDDARAVAQAVSDALERGTRLVVTAGGLGPMADDRTLAGVSDALRVPLALHHGAREMVEAAFRRLRARGRIAAGGLDAARETMCALPIGAEAIENAEGTAPGSLARLPGGAMVLSLPGVASECEAVLAAAQPMLRDLAPRGHVARREIETATSDESSLRGILDRLAREMPQVWIQSHAPGFDLTDSRVRITLEASAAERNQAESLVEEALRRLTVLAAAG